MDLFSRTFNGPLLWLYLFHTASHPHPTPTPGLETLPSLSR